MPTVSVIVPTHNRPDMLAGALASIRAQTFTDYEVIIVSNGENEEMAALSRACAERHGTVYELPEGNLPAARNYAIAQAKGAWIAFLDDDDIWLQNKLELQLAEADRTGADMIASDYIEFYPDGHEAIGQRRIPEGWTYVQAICHQRWGVPPSAVMVRKGVLLDVGGFDPAQRFGEDDDLWRRISWRHRIHQMEEPLIRYRKGPGTMTQDRRYLRYKMRHFFKMLLDTPLDLRWAVPSPAVLARRWLLRTIMPRWLRQPRKQWAALRPGG
jgi:glycosyltransferase involved in cell wall biosynthesis